MSKLADRLDGSSMFRLSSWTMDVTSSMCSNLAYLNTLHDPLQVPSSRIIHFDNHFQSVIGNADRKVNLEGLFQRRVKEIYEPLMDSTSSEVLSQITGKLLQEFYKYRKLVQEVTHEIQSLSTCLYHCNKDNMHLVRHQARLLQSRKQLEAEMHASFKASTKYTRLMSQLEDIVQQFFTMFMKNRHPGLSASGLPKLKMDFSDVRFNLKGN